ncbi:RraA family protein [Phycisphaerales bacterium AB-hyl4]|uniref:Putative 4-hydroxy-4-methyl-2-oxoglutarate aldolase n=1 Tax=Natronomicrosphaera hydrolytica TaxID=3242702 RepID=A0ABV4U3S3_9BACT
MTDVTQTRSAAADWIAWGSAATGDALRGEGYPFQCMDAGIHAVAPGMKVAGPAYTVRTYPGATWALGRAIEQASAGDVLVVDAGGRPDVIIMGELMSMRAQQRGIAGVVVDGAVRDIADIDALGFPMFARYVCPRSGTHDKVGQWQTPIACGRVVVNPGDWIVADESGVTAVPADVVEPVARATAQVKAKEAAIARHLKAGCDLGTACEKAAASLHTE